MVYFPQNVFKGITSYLAPLYPTRAHPVARMLESELGVWMLSLRLNTDAWGFDEETHSVKGWGRKKIFQGFFITYYPLPAFTDGSLLNSVYKQRIAGARRGWYERRPTILNTYEWRGLFQFGVQRISDNKYLWEARLNPSRLFGTSPNFTNRDMIKYLKENGIKGYSKKKRKELISMCLSF